MCRTSASQRPLRSSLRDSRIYFVITHLTANLLRVTVFTAGFVTATLHQCFLSLFLLSHLQFNYLTSLNASDSRRSCVILRHVNSFVPPSVCGCCLLLSNRSVSVNHRVIPGKRTYQRLSPSPWAEYGLPGASQPALPDIIPVFLEHVRACGGGGCYTKWRPVLPLVSSPEGKPNESLHKNMLQLYPIYTQDRVTSTQRVYSRKTDAKLKTLERNIKGITEIPQAFTHSAKQQQSALETEILE